METADERDRPDQYRQSGRVHHGRARAGHVIALTGSASAIEHRPLPQDDPRQRQPDITLARELLGWEPTVPLEQGLARTIDYFRTLEPVSGQPA